jgi:hypothetical protein
MWRGRMDLTKLIYFFNRYFVVGTLTYTVYGSSLIADDPVRRVNQPSTSVLCPLRPPLTTKVSVLYRVPSI